MPVTQRSGKATWVQFRFACDKRLRYATDRLALASLRLSPWARAYYQEQRARGHKNSHALRALAAKWLKIIFVMWSRHVPYSEEHHLATISRQTKLQPNPV